MESGGMIPKEREEDKRETKNPKEENCIGYFILTEAE